MLNILINAYAVSPNWGSEPGVGWNWIINIAKHCNVFVITEAEWKDEILEAVEKLPQKENIHFYFNPVPEKVRKMCWNQGDWRFYWYYRKWQKKTLEIAKQIIAENHIDVMHQLNMIGFREPGYLWKIKDIPLVWGPVGGIGQPTPTKFLNGNTKYLIKHCAKRFITYLQLRFDPNVRKMIKNSHIIAAVPSVQNKLKNIYKIDAEQINETGTYAIGAKSKEFLQSDKFEILWVGRLLATKRLDIAIETMKYVKNKKARLSIVGTGTEEETAHYLQLIKETGLSSDTINWIGPLEHSKISGLMQKSDLFFMTSVADATSTVVVEAISEGLPILSFNACGFGKLVKDFAGETIELTNPKHAAIEFANKIDKLSTNIRKLQDISKKQSENRYILSWDYKATRIKEIYESLVPNES